MTPLPIESYIGHIQQTLESSNQVVLTAPPGSGKSTVLPLALLDQSWLNGKQVWLLEPRRLAAKQVAQRLASSLGQSLGEKVGLITGDDHITSPTSSLIVMTEGVANLAFLKDNELTECGLLIFDEFHERSLETDLALAFSQQCCDILRPDLKRLVMSATLHSQTLADMLEAPLIECEGRAYPVDIEYVPFSHRNKQLELITQLIIKTSTTHRGDILVFLPGTAQIKHVHRELSEYESALNVMPLFGQMPSQQQAAIFSPSDKTKVILATDIAKTSLTIDGITTVIDSGLERTAQFNPNTGMNELVTQEASQATMIQRSGRAGRTQAGRAIRLGSEEQFNRRRTFTQTAIEKEDLTSWLLRLACWGGLDLNDYLLVTPPNEANVSQGKALLEGLEAINPQGTSTEHGSKMVLLGLHPRLAHMLMRVKDEQANPEKLATACALAALVSEGDPLYFDHMNSDLDLRMELISESLTSSKMPHVYADGRVNKGILSRLLKRYKSLTKQFSVSAKIQIDHQYLAELCVLAYPDRIAQKRGSGYRLQNGMGAQIHQQDALKPSEYLIVCELSSNRDRQTHMVKLATSIEATRLLPIIKPLCQWHHRYEMQKQLMQISELKFGQLILQQRQSVSDVTGFKEYLKSRLQSEGLHILPFDERCEHLLARLRLAQQHQPALYPSFDEVGLITDAENWLCPFITESNSQHIPLQQALKNRLDWPQQQQLDKDLPTHFTLPSGRDALIDYRANPPIVKAKLQECFGIHSQPTVAKGSIALSFHLLSPAQRPLAQTTDFAFFWRDVYPQVRKENRGRYAKHPWPEDPLTAQASSKTKRQQSH